MARPIAEIQDDLTMARAALRRALTMASTSVGGQSLVLQPLAELRAVISDLERELQAATMTVSHPPEVSGNVAALFGGVRFTASPGPGF